MSKVMFTHFASFMNDKNFWNNWTIQMSPEDDEKYFIESWAMTKSNSFPSTDLSKVSSYFDFSLTGVTLLSKGDSINWELDGEHISKFFHKWYRGEVR